MPKDMGYINSNNANSSMYPEEKQHSTSTTITINN